VNFAPITEDLVFIGVKPTSIDHYLLMTTDFSNSNSIIWEKQINCPGTG